jgi:hypothetical protein
MESHFTTVNQFMATVESEHPLMDGGLIKYRKLGQLMLADL